MMLTKSILILATICTATSYHPNIIIITADDLGYSDVGFQEHSKKDANTKWLNHYAESSVVLKNYYVMPNGHSSRTALLTGKHPAVLGTQFEMKDGTIPYGLDPSHTLLPEYLKELDYSCHAVGQWDLGFYSEDLLPTQRGYDSFFGSYLSYGDYKTHRAKDQAGHEGHDLRDNEKMDYSYDGHFKTELYSEKAVKIIKDHDTAKPLHLYLALQGAQIKDIDVLCSRGPNGGKIPNDHYDGLLNVDDKVKKCYLALVQAVDEAFGAVMLALQSKMMLQNSVVIFTSTSGGPAAGQQDFNAASNFPYRGAKLTGWEGGVKGVGLIYSERFDITNKITTSSCMFHITDWIPTLLSLYADVTELNEPLSLDAFSPMYGKDQFECLFNGGSSNRVSIIHFLYGNTASVLNHQYKYLVNIDGKLDSMDEWYSNTNYICGDGGRLRCNPRQRACLFDIEDDPCEKRNLAALPSSSIILKSFQVTINNFNKTVKYSDPDTPDPKGDPANFDYAWKSWRSSVSKASSLTCSVGLSTIFIILLLV